MAGVVLLASGCKPETDQPASQQAKALVQLDRNLLGQFPDGYRHLAYVQTKNGFTVKRDMPTLKGALVEALYQRGAAWLAGGALQSTN